MPHVDPCLSCQHRWHDLACVGLVDVKTWLLAVVTSGVAPKSSCPCLGPFADERTAA